MICLPLVLVEEKHFWEFPFSIGMQRARLCFSSLLSLFLSLFSPTSHPLIQLKSGSLAYDPWEELSLTMLRILRFWSAVCVLIYELHRVPRVCCCLVLGCILPYLTASLDYSAFFPNKSKYILQMSFPFMQSHLVITGILNFAYLQGPNKGKLINERCDSVSV